jgi:hypothetical protein
VGVEISVSAYSSFQFDYLNTQMYLKAPIILNNLWNYLIGTSQSLHLKSAQGLHHSSHKYQLQSVSANNPHSALYI